MKQVVALHDVHVPIGHATAGAGGTGAQTSPDVDPPEVTAAVDPLPDEAAVVDIPLADIPLVDIPLVMPVELPTVDADPGPAEVSVPTVEPVVSVVASELPLPPGATSVALVQAAIKIATEPAKDVVDTTVGRQRIDMP